jgi:hypothetical protein
MKKPTQIDARIAALSKAPLDSWIALSDDETKLIAQGTTYQAVADKLDELGDETSIILKTPPSWLPLAL